VLALCGTSGYDNNEIGKAGATNHLQRLEVDMTKKQRLLVIDDSKETVAGLNSFLSQKYEVITAYNGLDGLKAFEMNEGTIDLVITDLVMPEISGVGVISIIKKKYPGTPVIAITGWGEHPGALATEADANLVLDKPFELMDLERHVAELLAGKK
jgi:DNA-binding NtrC family response regulator